MKQMLKEMIEIKNENFYLNGKPVFYIGGELHYFRLPFTEWRNRIQKIKEAGGNLVSTYVPWLWHELTEGNFDLTGKTRKERDLKSFIEMVQEEGLHLLVRPGPYVMAETIESGIPLWLINNYPEILAKKQNGDVHPAKVVSYLHPVYLEKVEKWYKAVSEIIAPRQITEGGPVLLWHLDNEIGMFHWITNQGDYSEITLAYFLKFMEDRFSLNELNKKIGVVLEEYNDLVYLLKNLPRDKSLFIQQQYHQFMREYFYQYGEILQKIAKKNGIEIPFIINVHGFDQVDYAKRGLRYPIGLSQLYSTSRLENVVIAGDYYIGNIVHENYTDLILANVLTKAMQSEKQPLFSAEFQGGFQHGKPRIQPTTIDLTSRLCIATGMNSLNYYMFVGGINFEGIGILGKTHDWQAPVSTDGSLKKHYYTIQYLVKVLRAVENELLLAKNTVQTFLGIDFDLFMTEYEALETKEVYRQIKDFRERFFFNGVAKALSLRNILYGGLDLRKTKEIRVEEFPSLWVLSTPWMDKEVQDKLLKYVVAGGKLVLYPALPTKELNGEECTILKDGIGVSEIKRSTERFISFAELDSVQVQYLETYKGKDLSGFAWVENTSSENSLVGFQKKIGQGEVILFGAGIELDQGYHEEVVVMLAEKIGVKPVIKQADYIDFHVRSIPHTLTKFIFIHNFDEYDKEMEFDYQGEKLFDGNLITISARSGLLLPINLPLTNEVVLKYATCEIVERKDKEISFSCRQNKEIIKLNRPAKVIIPNYEDDTYLRTEYLLEGSHNDYRITIINAKSKIVTLQFQ